MIHVAICDDSKQSVYYTETITDNFFKKHCVDCKIQTYQSSVASQSFFNLC